MRSYNFKHKILKINSKRKPKSVRARVLNGACLLAPLCAQRVHIELCSHGYFRW